MRQEPPLDWSHSLVLFDCLRNELQDTLIEIYLRGASHELNEWEHLQLNWISEKSKVRVFHELEQKLPALLDDLRAFASLLPFSCLLFYNPGHHCSSELNELILTNLFLALGQANQNIEER